MGKFINNRTITAVKILELQSPIFLCVKIKDFDKLIMQGNVQSLSLNLPLAKSLYKNKYKEIESSITDIVSALFPEKSTVYLTDYEMLFDPRYKLDVIKLFCEISRYCNLIVKWCGVFENNLLIYSEPGYADYNTYNASDYNIACII